MASVVSIPAPGRLCGQKVIRRQARNITARGRTSPRSRCTSALICENAVSGPSRAPSKPRRPSRMTTHLDHVRVRYDSVPYASYAYPQCAPEHLAAVATLFGHAAPDPRTARVLELGGASGGNVIPFAVRNPGGEAVCVDLSELETQPLHHVLSQLVYATGRQQVSDVWIAGRRKLDQRELVDIDTAALIANARQWRTRIAALSAAGTIALGAVVGVTADDDKSHGLTSSFGGRCGLQGRELRVRVTPGKVNGFGTGVSATKNPPKRADCLSPCAPLAYDGRIASGVPGTPVAPAGQSPPTPTACEPMNAPCLALALLLAGPALSRPNMLVIGRIRGMKKTVVFVSLVILMATFSGLLYGSIWG